jgi:hypothetical protein
MLVVALAELCGCTLGPRSADTTSGQGGAQLHSGMPIEAPTSVIYVSSCNIEALNGAPSSDRAVVMHQGEALNLTGWVVDEAAHQSPVHVFILLQSAEVQEFYWAPISGRLPRPDVAKTRNSTLLSGFSATLDTSTLPPGEYGISMLFWQNGPSQICDNGRRIAIKSQ